ncbi:hypothetical protein FNF27_05899 [Cafeteria roenbergensis]|uniref:Uncharacterized protein n=1 Tax=Cafeteria roenbergensis TaxID=33653 RepID=A0A5A8E4G1_CAFRO|nr:hypothetical protein FNF29_02562 [Cafeteria roenbergensis]KAA0159554.1 hypothetical protein FNF31_04793 [Cafeteria roenbergensis]KAA0159758.1 hypothetical protein FNF28_05721 [Cafeteria roenbergensis]KAA0172675.1 hypothetical protein FNF27_05899 [Cafeteria roenbergensis]|eukprot:KAA0154342.1 hypothetical protein FNF29_02562 [Cafeteria roenbergensis]
MASTSPRAPAMPAVHSAPRAVIAAAAARSFIQKHDPYAIAASPAPASMSLIEELMDSPLDNYGTSSFSPSRKGSSASAVSASTVDLTE